MTFTEPAIEAAATEALDAWRAFTVEAMVVVKAPAGDELTRLELAMATLAGALEL